MGEEKAEVVGSNKRKTLSQGDQRLCPVEKQKSTTDLFKLRLRKRNETLTVLISTQTMIFSST